MRLGQLAAALGIAIAIAAAAPRGAHGRGVSTPADLRAADSLAAAPAASGRTQAFRAWARHATLPELMYVLRRTPRELGELDGAAVEAARSRSGDRPALRAALGARLAAEREHRAAHAVSAFRVALLLPDSGAYADDAAALERGFRAALAARRPALQPPVECVRISTGADAPPDVAAALDSAAAAAGLACGGFDPAAVPVFAAASRWCQLPLLLPLSTDPVALALSPRAWSLDPPGEERGRALANAVRAGTGDRIAVLASSARSAGFVDGFDEACRARGAQVVVRERYAAGNAGFQPEVRAILNARATVLFWDGAPPEAAALLRELTRQRVSLRVCGGEGLSPERHHAETRVLLEGVVFVRDDWSLTPADEAALEQAIPADAGGAAEDAEVRGFLAGRILGAAMAAGALTPDELITELNRLGSVSGGLRALGLRSEGAELPVYSVAAGQAERVQ